MVASLDTVRAKLRRANEHRQAFDRLFAEFLDRDPYAIAFNFEPDTGWHVFTWQVRFEPPAEDLALVFGDMLTNLRGTLDYLVWQLVLLNQGTPTDRTEFPVVRKGTDWDATRGDRLKGVADVWGNEIEKLQPYHRRDRPEVHPSAILDHVNNINKHRVLPVAVVTPELWRPQIDVRPMPTGDHLDFEPFLGPIEHGAHVLRFRWRETHQQLEVAMNEQPTFRVSFRDGLDYDWTNDQIFDYVAGVVRIFEPAFAG